MIIQALHDHYRRGVGAGRTAAYGFEVRQIHWIVRLDIDGNLRAVESALVDGEPIPLTVPRWATSRTQKIIPSFLSDPIGYVLAPAIDNRAEAKLAAWVEHNSTLLAGATSPELVAVRRWLATWSDDAAKAISVGLDLVKMTNVAILVDGTWAHSTTEAADIWGAHLAAVEQAGAAGLCLVTGDVRPLARNHKSIAGNAKLISVDKNNTAQHHYGHADTRLCPVSVEAEHGYTEAIASMRRDGQESRIGDYTVLYWIEAEDAAQSSYAELMRAIIEGSAAPSPAAEAGKLTDAVAALAKGRLPTGLLPSAPYHLLALRRGQGRAAVAWHLRSTLGDLTVNVGNHLNDLGWRDPSTLPAIWQLIKAAHHEKQEARPGLRLDMLKAILTGGRYPDDMAYRTLSRLIAGEEMTSQRAAILRAWIVRNKGVEDMTTSAAYRLGEVLALAEYAQRRAIGDPATTIAQRYWSAMATRPSMALARVLTAVQTYKPTLARASSRGTAVWVDQQIAAALDGVTIPARMTSTDHAQMALGYYSRKGRADRKDDDKAAVADDGTSPETSS